MANIMGDALIGKKIDKYVIKEKLGSGGMAEVYKGYQENLDRFVAIKFLHEFLVSDQDFLHRFQREARALAALNHPNIVRVHDFDLYGEKSYYLVMEYIRGGTLKDRLEALAKQGERIPPSDVVKMTADIADALAYAHRQEMVHRDIKPGNIMLNEDTGRAVLTDFGIVKLIGNQSVAFTATGALIGTPSYMSPEQALGQPGDHRADIYSLGVMLFQMVTGSLPFNADTPLAVVMQHVNSPVPHLDSINPNVPSRLQEIIFKAMAKSPEDRFQSADEIAVALREVDSSGKLSKPAILPPSSPALPKSEVAVPTTEASFSHTTSQTAHPKKRLIWLSLVIGVVILTILGGILTFNGILRDTAATTVVANLPTINATEDLMETRFLSPTSTDVPDLTPTSQAVVDLATATRPGETPVATLTLAPSPSATFDPNSVPPPNAVRGSNWIRPADGMEMVFVPSGTFLMGSDPDIDTLANNDEMPQHEVSLDSYWIDRTEVTNEQFAIFVADTGYQTTAEVEGWGLNFLNGEWQRVEGAFWQRPQGPTSDIVGLENHPVVQVSWNDATAYCEWTDSTLPTEAQWEYAARGVDSSLFPWGNLFDQAKANYCDKNCNRDFADQEGDDGFALTAPIGSYSGNSWVGAADMAGNVWEWVNDWYDSNYYENASAYNPSGPISGELKVLRGGGWYNGIRTVRAAFRSYVIPTGRHDGIGFRCARSSSQP